HRRDKPDHGPRDPLSRTLDPDGRAGAHGRQPGRAPPALTPTAAGDAARRRPARDRGPRPLPRRARGLNRTLAARPATYIPARDKRRARGAGGRGAGPSVALA